LRPPPERSFNYRQIATSTRDHSAQAIREHNERNDIVIVPDARGIHRGAVDDCLSFVQQNEQAASSLSPDRASQVDAPEPY
jgi:hypothetical protein